jgi:hypothetical protein
MLPWVTAVVLLVFPIAVADFDYRYLLPVLPFACLAAALALAPARARIAREPNASLPAGLCSTSSTPGPPSMLLPSESRSRRPSAYPDRG